MLTENIYGAAAKDADRLSMNGECGHKAADFREEGRENLSDSEKIDLAARKILERYRDAFRELAK